MSTKNIRKQLADLREAIIEDITSHLDKKNAHELQLNRSLIYRQSEDDQFDEILDRVTRKGIVISYQGDDVATPTFEDLSFDTLLAVLDELEAERYEVYEEENSEQGGD